MTITESGGGVVSAEEARRLRQRLLEQLTEKANSGDQQALAEFRNFLDEHPEVGGRPRSAIW